MDAVCVFCGSRLGHSPIYRKAAERLGAELARRGLRLIYGGGRVGLMGIIADTVIAHGGEVLGIIPETLANREIPHGSLTELIVVQSMHERKAKMEARADGFIALPGGFGTLEEFCEILTWAQLGIHQKPLGLLNVDGFYEPLVAFFDDMLRKGFVQPEHRSLIQMADDPATLLDAFTSYVPPDLPRWVTTAET